jgi:LL-diaminopimelate aminotransferase
MIRLNDNYLKLAASYLFSDIAKRVSAFQAANPDKQVIRLGIGDVTQPLPKSVISAMHKAVDEMGNEATFRGYGPEQGYDFLREAIAKNDFQANGAQIEADEVFVSDGAKCDTGNFQELFDLATKIAVPDPVYPVYVDTNVMAGRTGVSKDGRYDGLVYLESTEENGFVPSPPKEKVDLIYLCFPNNPTGSVATKAQLKQWVDYARENKALLLFDAAYEAFIRDPELPRSIYEIDGARECAVEFRSYSKTAGFTGTRCAYTVIPKSVMVYDKEGKAHPLHGFWNRRHTTKFNGTSYPIQRAAAAIYSEEGKAEVKALNDYYLENARLIVDGMSKLGFTVFGGKNAPYVWIKAGMASWDFFDMLLTKAAVVCTPGEGFGKCGRGYVRISAFNSREKVEQALSRISLAVK